MADFDIDPLEADWKIQTSTQDKTRSLVVPHINARIGARALDQMYGAAFWSDDFRPFSDSTTWVVCRITVLSEDGSELVHREGMAEPTSIEPAKGGESDAFKRACVKLGIGRNLYDLPSVWIRTDVDKRGKAQLPDDYLKQIAKILDRQLAADDPALSSPALAPQPETPPVSVAPTPTRGESPVTIGPGDDGDVIFGEVGDVEASPGPIIPPTPEHVLGEGVTEADTIPVIKQWIHALYDSMAYAGIWGADALEKHLAAQMLRLELEEVPKPAGKPRFAIGDLRRKENMLTFAVNARRAAVRDLVRDVSDE